MDITIIGTGNMGRGIGTRLVKGGHHLTLINDDKVRASVLADELRKSSAPNANVAVSSYEEGVHDGRGLGG